MPAVRERNGFSRAATAVSFYGSAFACSALVAVLMLLLFQTTWSLGRLEARVESHQATIDQQQQAIDEIRAKFK